MIKNTRKPRTVESLYVIWGVSIALTLFAVSSFLSWPDFRTLYASDRLYCALSACLALITFALFGAYVMATFNEINLLNQFIGEDPIPRVKPKVIVIAFGLAILFGVLIAVSRELLIYAGAMICYNLLDLLGSREVAKQMGPAINRKLQEQGNDALKSGLQKLHDFYFERPIIPRIVTILFVNLTVFLLALVHYFTNDATYRTLAYCLQIANIIVSEIVIQFWRWRTIYQID